MPPIIGQYLGKECSVKEGWISGILMRLAKETQGPELGICYPVECVQEEKKQQILLEQVKQVSCYGFYENTVQPELYDEEPLIKRFRQILEDFKPDVVHIFGTEFGHSLAVVKAFGNPKRTLIGLQGVISECAKEYMADLPEKVQNKVSFRDWLKKDSMIRQQEKFSIRGEREKEAVALCGNITGRTEFDKNAAYSLNPRANYYFMNETLRQEFYEGKWEWERCKKHRIFFSQADYPLKGFHYLLEALDILSKQYPDITVAVAGNSLVSYQTLKDRIKISAYGQYLRSLIHKLNMEDKIIFLGKLSAEEMKQQYLQCHAFVCASSLENSPNSVGEAMLLGVPVAASCTGGIPSMLTSEKEGVLFEKGNPKALAEAVIQLWENPKQTLSLSENAKVRARKTHNADVNYKTLLEIYDDIVNHP